MDIEKICRCCLALSGPLLSIYDGGSAGMGCVADMLKEIAKLKPQPNDNMPEKACLQCISEINRCFIFKVKCENSNRTLRQLLPEAIKEPIDDVPTKKIITSTAAVQTEDKVMVSSLQQTMEEENPLLCHKEIQTMVEEKSLVCHKEIQTMVEEKSLVCHKEIKTRIEEKSNLNNAEVQTEYEIMTDISSQTKLEKLIEDSPSEEFVFYEKVETPSKKRKKSIKYKIPMKNPCLEINKVETEEQESYILFEDSNEKTNALPISPSGKSLSPSNQNILNTVEEQITKDTCILLEDSNQDSNCSNEQDLYLDESQQDLETIESSHQFEYEVENPDNDQHSTTNPDDEYIYSENLDDYEEFESSEIVLQSSKVSKTFGKKSKSSSISKRKDLYQCSQCIMTFFSIKVLRRHLANRHNITDAEFIISLEPEIKNSTTEIEEPSSSNSRNNVQKTGAELIAENVPNPQLLPRERVTSSVNEEVLNQMKYYCDNCHAGFAQSKTLNYHMKQNICITSNYQCNQCERMFVSQDNLDVHKLTHESQHKCLECHVVCKAIEELSNHMIEEHNRNARNQCHVCKKVFTMKTSLMDHLRIHSGEKPFLCTICGKSFRQNSNLRQHLLRHNNEKKYKCDMCSNAYITKSELFSHTRTHTGDHPYKCDECSACFTTSCSLQKHKRKHTGERPYACEYCPMRFAALNVLKNHRRIHTGEKPFKCNFCEKSFTQKGDCLMHQRTHHRDLTCFCGSKFTKKANLKFHIKTKHENVSENELNSLINKIKNTAELSITLEGVVDDEHHVLAEEDGVDFVNASNEEEGDLIETLSTNRASSNDNDELMEIVLDEFECNQCDHIFIYKENLAAHKLTHNKTHKCTECFKIYKTDEELIQHIIKEHSRNSNFKCHVCKKVFTMKTTLLKHFRIHNGNTAFLCTICGKRLTTNSNLRMHIRRHNKEATYKCDICNNAFVTRIELSTHKRTHSGYKSFVCVAACSSYFTTQSNLQRHKRKCKHIIGQFNCGYCDKVFIKKTDYLIHRNEHVLIKF